jgi:hypothetical protein
MVSNMDVFEKTVVKSIKQFETNLYKAATSPSHNWAKKMQQKFDGLVPKQIHQSFAFALEKGIKTFLQGLQIHQEKQKIIVSSQPEKSLHELTEEAEQIVSNYTKLAAIEGAGTGFGGFIASTIDFPALISIKLKMLQELAMHFGYPLVNLEERIYIVRVLQLQFSSKYAKQKNWLKVKEWDTVTHSQEWDSWENFNWEEFYMEYKQSIELIKMLQMVPGFGALVGGLANYAFLNDLGNTAILCFQMRKIIERYDQNILS